ncbi:tRNA (N6-isopentenyl adenosine(37)-C2)-methylthiotransferase MiaB [Fimbriimonas ginsengisoli]|uniref:tRNA-2-methylthio-N(6)-dimethylallyladenosine synthase n=1 Tax=Fimbriimonas ginsengisoli Gsoil 348 TaxID=661478 RepID=A0A068NVN0_FIMGI|nr:tRNA (N6-isopentenyl adenosine(37)-C2)-methylthiotransferase MiaB [Fimbriimonas ginsengisoli]AIE87432.1 tRNA-i(6)A37 modification enzyme MiaB [Fimbriimonas ginsengisoli Gsoil 348]
MIPISQPGNVAFAERPVRLSDETRRGTYFVQTWGCQMNEEDSEQMSLYLEDLGFERAASILEAQVIILNTCSVRKKPEDKAFSLLGELIPLKAARRDTIIGVCGCMAQARADEIRRRAPHVDFVLGTGDLGQLPGLVEQAAQTRKFAKRVELPERKGRVVEDVPQRHLGRAPKLKAFVPIQYGCDKFCTYCIVPNTRGRERSRPTEDILEEVTRLAEGGTKEITLLGQTVNSYGKNLLEGRVPFSELLWKLAEIPGLERIRYTSPYPRDFTRDLIECIRDCPKVMEHVHLPIQSGDNDVLREMKRVYTLESYGEIVAELRATVPGITLTTDVIVGFPGETDEQFEHSLDAFRSLRFDGAYMFAYSTRPGTPAGDREDQVPAALKKERLNRIIALQNEITCEINATYLGRELEVLVEGPSPKKPELLQGYSRECKMIHFAGASTRAGRLAKVRVTGSAQWGLSAELI